MKLLLLLTPFSDLFMVWTQQCKPQREMSKNKDKIWQQMKQQLYVMYCVMYTFVKNII